MEYFNVKIEFNHLLFHQKISDAIKSKTKGYVCMIDANILTIAQKNNDYCGLLNNSLINTCDGSSIAMMASSIYNKKFRALNGPDIFALYIEQNHKQLLLGSNEDTLNLIKSTLNDKGIKSTHLSVLPLSFLAVEQFDYKGIAKEINRLKPDIIWVSLGAPKQELFMNYLLPHINSGVLFGIGAAFNFYVGKIGLPKASLGALKFIWISRIFSEPKKQISRILPYLKILPKLYWEEKKKYRTQAKKNEL